MSVLPSGAEPERLEERPAGALAPEERAVEAVLLAAVEPVPARLLAELLEEPVEVVVAVCQRLAARYRTEQRGFVLAEVAGGYRLQTHPEMAPFVERFARQGLSARLSAAALETLAIVAYKQPISRAQIAALRGVNVDGVVRLLVQRGLVAEVGHAPGPGQPTLYGTTPLFLEQLGLRSLEDLPAVEDLVPDLEVVELLEAKVRGLPDLGSVPGPDGDGGLDDPQ
jgi:segregation and condensation protein B